MKRLLGMALLGVAALGLAGGAMAQSKVKLTIESWRNDDLKIWQETILPAFMKANPNIEVVFAPSAPTEYNAVLDTKLKAGTAGDLITCRPFDKSLELFQAKHLDALNDLRGMANFSEVAKAAWSTDDGKTTFCVPMASVIHGFLYNAAIFKELNIAPPKTEAEFLAALRKIQQNGKYSPLVMGTKDQWESATMGLQNIGPTLWGGEAGRKALINGSGAYNRGGFLRAFQALERWKPFLPRGYQALAYPDAQNLFAQGRGAIYPAGSWDIGTFRQMNKNLELGAFRPYTFAGNSQCVINDHPDIAIGLNAASKNKEAARTFLNWVATDAFAQLYANALPGFFPLANVKYTVSDPIAQQFLDWRGQCRASFRTAYQILSRNANPNNENDLWNASAQVLNGSFSALQAANFVQSRLASWYGPQKNNK
ncbi:MAG: ABC transporter substrate-binding protein [Meiothermus sp.]|nr:ABC transporter substrate-binding protein [Meiothermus sp.]